ncbi:MAG TPA: MauE/DoxX family redox-associated membrane protein [Candidatus Paceibacterota bacterium]|nr:MauE/DoxX family redox-associated membrane protein [Candidatus Paceibacterota bacterium]
MDNHIHVHNSSGTMGHSLSDFYPLFGVLALVLALTAVGVLYLEQDLMLAFMGYFFVVFGGLKVLRLKGFVEAYQMYDVLAMRSKAYAYAYPFLELGFGLAYLLAWQVQAVSAVVVPVMLIGAWGVYRKLRAGEEIPCACLGTVFTVPMTWVTLGEDLLMAAMALMILLY